MACSISASVLMAAGCRKPAGASTAAAQGEERCGSKGQRGKGGGFRGCCVADDDDAGAARTCAVAGPTTSAASAGVRQTGQPAITSATQTAALKRNAAAVVIVSAGTSTCIPYGSAGDVDQLADAASRAVGVIITVLPRPTSTATTASPAAYLLEITASETLAGNSVAWLGRFTGTASGATALPVMRHGAIARRAIGPTTTADSHETGKHRVFPVVTSGGRAFISARANRHGYAP